MSELLEFLHPLGDPTHQVSAAIPEVRMDRAPALAECVFHTGSGTREAVSVSE